MRSVIFFDHLDTCPAVFCNLVDVRAFHEPQADIGMTQAVSRASLLVAVKFQILLFQDVVEHFDVIAWEDFIGRGWRFRYTIFVIRP